MTTLPLDMRFILFLFISFHNRFNRLFSTSMERKTLWWYPGWDGIYVACFALLQGKLQLTFWWRWVSRTCGLEVPEEERVNQCKKSEGSRGFLCGFVSPTLWGSLLISMLFGGFASFAIFCFWSFPGRELMKYVDLEWLLSWLRFPIFYCVTGFASRLWLRHLF